MAAHTFSTFYEYFLYTKSWAYILMFMILPAYVVFWRTLLYPCKKCCGSKESSCEHK